MPSVLGTVLITVTAALLASSAYGDPQTKTDIMFLFDTSGSMESTLNEASVEIKDTIQQIDSQLPDVQYGLSEVRDYGGTAYDPKNPGQVPWQLTVPITPDRARIANGIAGLRASGGGDNPEAYSRALWEVATNPTVGWRHKSSRVVVLIVDSVPHDDDLDQGVPESSWIQPPPWNTGNELLEPAGVTGTVLSDGSVLDWQSVLQQLAANGITLEVIAYHGDEGLLPYWKNWASRTGGEAVLGQTDRLGSKILALAKASGGRHCRTVRGSVGKRLLASLRCRGGLAPLRAVCGSKLTIARSLASLSLAKGQVDRLKKGAGPLAVLVNAIRAAKFLRHAPPGFATPAGVIGKLRHPHTAIELIKLLPHLARALSRRSFERIAVAISNIDGARACAKGLITAVK